MANKIGGFYKWLMIIGYLLIFSVIAYLLISLYRPSPHKSDSEMISAYQENKDDFNRLIQMVREDKRNLEISISKDAVNYQGHYDKNDYLSKERSDHYAELFRQFGIGSIYVTNICPNCPKGTPKRSVDKQIVTHIEMETSYFAEKYFSDFGRCYHPERKGYVWDINTVENKTDDLDLLRKQNGYFSGKRWIDGNVEIFFVRTKNCPTVELIDAP